MPQNRLSVLVVESEAFTLDELTSLLGKAVTTVLAAKSGHEALALLREKRPDILVTDLLFHDLDSLQYLQKIRDIDPDIPIMVLFEGYNPSAIIKSLEFNISGFLKKPVKKEQFYQHLWRVAKGVLLRQKLFETKSMFERTLDVFPGYVVLVEENQTSYLNSKLLTYLGYSNHSDLHESGDRFEKFIKEVNDRKHDGSSDWIRDIIHDPLDREHMIRLTSSKRAEEQGRVFAVQFTEFHKPDTYLFTFTDVSDLQHDRSTFEGQASMDPLTGVYNRRKFLEISSLQEMHLATSGTPLSIIMFDIDHFKKVNDTFGHDVGDVVLKEICIVARNSVRDSDHIGRWGGEEFMILLPGADLRQARTLAERLRKEVENYAFSGVVGPLTSSFGVAQWRPDETRDAFLKRLDEALYEAKKTGRNKVVIA